jgi:hypothetical protein
MLNSTLDILLEFVERQAYAPRVTDFVFGQSLVNTGAAYRAAGLCPDCGKAPENKRMRCVVCARKHAIKCREARQKKKKESACQRCAHAA